MRLTLVYFFSSDSNCGIVDEPEKFLRMAIFFFLFLIFRVCLSCSAHMKQKNKIKLLEDYVVSADFDSNLALPQLKLIGRPNAQISEELIDATKNRVEENMEAAESINLEIPKESSDSIFLRPESSIVFQNGEVTSGQVSMEKYGGPHPDERDLAGPGPTDIASASSLFAIGFITFLILLSSLQSSLSFMIRQPTLLGSITKPLKRKRRFMTEEELRIYFH